jgi:chromosome partitioning protein
MQVISFVNMKGGVGKTTLAVNVAYGLAYFHRKNVLLVDSDPQFNATQAVLTDQMYLSHIKDPAKGTLRDIFIPRRPGPVNTVKGTAKSVNRLKMPLSACSLSIYNPGPGRGKLDLIPSSLELIDIDTSQRGTERKLKVFLQEKATGYDYVIIDCPPTISIFTMAAILASDKFLVPLKPDPLSVIGLPLLERWLEEFTDEQGIQSKLKNIGLVFTLVRGPVPSAMAEVMADLRRQRKDQVFNNYLSQANDVAKSVIQREPTFIYKRNSKTGQQLKLITAEFLERTKED